MQRTEGNGGSNGTLIDVFGQAVSTHSEKPALLFKPGFRYLTWTYQQMWDSAGRVAAMLQQRGIGKGDRVVLWSPNCPQWTIAFFGCMRAGAITVPLSEDCTGDFAERVISKTDPKLALVSKQTQDTLQGTSVPGMLLEELEETCSSYGSPEDVDLESEDIVEIMYTSGTTGNPKGVMLTHQSLVASSDAGWRLIPADSSWNMVSILPLSHVFEQLTAVLVPMRSGANTTYLTSYQPTVIFKTMQERKPKILLLVPRFLEMLMSRIETEIERQGKHWAWKLAKRLPSWARRFMFRQVHQRFGGQLKVIVSGAAALDPDVGRKWELLGFKVLQGYGATEASPLISAHSFHKPHYDSVGKPVLGVEVKISQDGEVLARGPNITPGYWGDREQTNAAFEGDWYKTGDLGFIDEDGFLHLKGRKKDMIVLPNGENVYPEDIEMVLARHPDVIEAVVVGLPKESRVEVHAALLTENPERAQEVVSWANSLLTPHQRVRGVTVWPDEDFPRTHTFKVRKNVVLERLMGKVTPLEPVDKEAERSDEHDPKATESLVAQVAGVAIERVTPQTMLEADLEMDSLKRVELLSTIEVEAGVNLDETLIGPETTVQQLTTMLTQGHSVGAPLKCPRWGMTWWCRYLRGFLQRAVMFPLLALFYRLRVSGREHLASLNGPILFAANHNLHMDNPLILKAMPPKVRRHVVIAATADAWRKWFRSLSIVYPLLGNAIPFSKSGAVKSSLESVGRVLDDGWSVLMYPEGDMKIGGPMLPFKTGPAMLATTERIPVVPLRLHINHMGRPWQLPFLRRGDIEIRFGKPMAFAPQTPHEDAARALEEAVRAL